MNSIPKATLYKGRKEDITWRIFKEKKKQKENTKKCLYIEIIVTIVIVPFILHFLDSSTNQKKIPFGGVSLLLTIFPVTMHDFLKSLTIP
ncbi:LOW QUALITY PROTEIN: hypothetical protein V1478_012968 [Vespula squamosa]|uniref:Uncharacterized protein n=1 Tax=Vespula squamosa TaxID=30214 RepID=A0ABD2A9G6_VESSQ